LFQRGLDESDHPGIPLTVARLGTRGPPQEGGALKFLPFWLSENSNQAFR